MSATEVVVTGLGLMTALGTTASENWQRLRAGESAIALRQPFLDLAPGPLAMIGKKPYDLDRLITGVVREAWEDAGLTLNSGKANRIGVVVGSSRSYLSRWETMAATRNEGEIEGSWLSALPHSPALRVACMLGSTGPVLAPMAACATGLWAIAQAADLIRDGMCDRVVAGAVEAPITRLTLAGFRKMGALAKTGCYPFDNRREGFVLGEGGAVLVLESAASALARDAQIYGRVLSTGITNDSHHVSSFDPSYKMGHRAVAQCLQRSGLTAQDIDAVYVHGTSTQQNDRMESSLIAQTFGPDLPVMASKGATGHTLGASGALTVALGLLSLQRQEMFPCVGLQEPAFDLNFIRSAQSAALKNILCLSFGFGGQNAVLALSR